MTQIVRLSQTEIEKETDIKDALRTPTRGIARIEMDKETKQRKEVLRRLNNLERRIDKDWRAQNAINEKAAEAMSTLLDMYAKYGHSTSERLQ
jgi:poly(A) polymerase Pap1